MVNLESMTKSIFAAHLSVEDTPYIEVGMTFMITSVNKQNGMISMHERSDFEDKFMNKETKENK